jgi:hypothetical protein
MDTVEPETLRFSLPFVLHVWLCSSLCCLRSIPAFFDKHVHLGGCIAHTRMLFVFAVCVLGDWW